MAALTPTLSLSVIYYGITIVKSTAPEPHHWIIHGYCHAVIYIAILSLLRF